MGNPPLSPMLDYAQDLMLILVSAFHRDGMPHTRLQRYWID